MQLVNYTPFPAITWEALVPDGREQGILLVRGCFDLSAGNTEPHLALHPAAEQGEWFGEDRFFGTPGQSAVRYESDFVPYKPRTDLILNAVTYSPSGSPQPRWQCGVGVADREGNDKQPTNVIRAPRIEAPRQPITDPHVLYPPQGFGFIHRAWQPRLALAGTFDSAWLANKHPLLPDDFKDAHHNGAHSDLIGAGLARGHLKGTATLRLEHLLPDQPICYLTLPGYRLPARLRLATGVAAYQKLNR